MYNFMCKKCKFKRQITILVFEYFIFEWIVYNISSYKSYFLKWALLYTVVADLAAFTISYEGVQICMLVALC